MNQRSHVGLAVKTVTIQGILEQAFRESGFAVVHPAPDPSVRLNSFANADLRLVVLECDADRLAYELFALNAALLQTRTPVLALVANGAAARWALEHGAREALVQPVEMPTLLRTALHLAQQNLVADATA